MNWVKLALTFWILAMPGHSPAARNSTLSISLDGVWTLVPDESAEGQGSEWARSGFPPEARTLRVRVPGAWQRYLPGYCGPAFYETTFECPDRFGPRAFLLIGAANYRAEGWLNGSFIGSHDGGYAPIRWEVTENLRRGRENRLVVRIVHSPPGKDVEGTALEKVPSGKETWYYPYSGIMGPVSLEARPDPSIDRIEIAPLFRQAKVKVKVAISTSTGEPFKGAITFKIGRVGNILPVRLNIESNPGRTCVVEKIMSIGRFKPWTPEKPVLYRLKAVLSKKGTQIEEKSAAFGMREVDFKDGFFLLNGRRVVLRGVLLQPDHPAGLGAPVDPQAGIKDLEMIKSLGFNLVRSHLKPLNEDQLEYCDTHGLMVYEETAAAWMAEDNSEKTFRIVSSQFRELVEEHINHPSIVIWGVSNENGRFAGEMGARLLSLAGGIDPSRPLIDVSGWSMNIYPEGGWMHETRVRRPWTDSSEFIEDHHHYLRSPVGSAEFGILRHLGNPSSMPSYEKAGYGPVGMEAAWKNRLEMHKGGIFVSEFGCGGLTDFGAALRGYEELRKGETSPPFTSTELVDETDYRQIYAELENGLRQRGLEKEFGSTSRFIEACQAQQALGVRRQIEAMRMNPGISGYVLTQFNDSSWECNAGVVGVWRDPKTVAGILPELNAPWLLTVRPSKAVVTTGTPAAFFLATLNSENLPRETVLEYRLESPGEEPGKDVLWSAAAAGKESVLEIPVEPNRAGRWVLRARLRRQNRILGGADSAIYAGSFGSGSQVSFSLIGDDSLLGPYKSWVIPLKESRVILVPDPAALSKRDLAKALKEASRGKKVVFMALNPYSAGKLSAERKFPIRGGLRKTISTFMGRFHYLRADFAARLPAVGPRSENLYLASEPFADLLPVYSLPELKKAVLHAGTIGMKVRIADRTPGNWFFLADVMEAPYGKGKLVFCQYRLLENLGSSPLAGEILYRLLSL